MTLLSATDPATVSAYLADQNFLQAGESLEALASAGEGNMNVTLKVTTNRRIFVLKQSRPFVARFPDIPAPIERIAVERDFLAATSDDDALFARQPAVLHYDAANYAMILEYLAGARDMSYVYKDATIGEKTLRHLGAYLSALHRTPLGDFPENKELRALNHAHIFDLPFQPENGFPLGEMVPGLAALARPYQQDDALREAAAELGEVYLSNGPILVHGDFYPGSFMERGGELLVIDGEFAHPGYAEFDLGVLLAHLEMARLPHAAVLTAYERAPGFEEDLMHRFRAVEIMRRLIGIAQLPLGLSLAEKSQLLEQARQVLVGHGC